MAEKMRSMRLSDERWAWLDEEAKRQGAGWSRTRVVEALIDAPRLGSASYTVGDAPVVRASRSGPTRLDSVPDASRWLADRQARLNAAKERAS